MTRWETCASVLSRRPSFVSQAVRVGRALTDCTSSDAACRIERGSRATGGTRGKRTGAQKVPVGAM